MVNRGVAIYQGKVYVGAYDGRLIALDAATGKVVWQKNTFEGQKGSLTITGAPRVFKGKVIIGNGGAEYGVRGYITAYDAETGAQVWRFYTVTGDPSKPFENPELEAAAKTWNGRWWELGGGGTAWDSMAYDPELDLLTPRELEVMRLLARGYAYKEIAAELFIGTKTVETHASNVLRKLQLSNRHQLTRWAAERRML